VLNNTAYSCSGLVDAVAGCGGYTVRYGIVVVVNAVEMAPLIRIPAMRRIMSRISRISAAGRRRKIDGIIVDGDYDLLTAGTAGNGLGHVTKLTM